MCGFAVNEICQLPPRKKFESRKTDANTYNGAPLILQRPMTKTRFKQRSAARPNTTRATRPPSALTTPTVESLSTYVTQNAAKVRKALSTMHGATPATSTRTADYLGHHIEIRTTYEIEIDGARLMTHLVVTDEGQVQCHALPNYTFLSAVDMVRALIDQFPDEFDGTAPMPMERHKHGVPARRSAAKSHRSTTRRKGHSRRSAR